MNAARKDLLVAAFLSFTVLVVYVLSPNATQFDSRWTVPTAYSLLHQGNADLNEYSGLIVENHYYAIECVKAGVRYFPIQDLQVCEGGRLYSFFPLGTSALAAPALLALEASLSAVQPVLGSLPERMSNPIRRQFLRGDFIGSSMLVELILASLITALAAAVMYFIAREFLSPALSAILTLLFSFGTAA